MKRTKTYFEQYKEEIAKGRIIIGKELKMLLDNLTADLDNPEYEYDTEDAHEIIEFIEGFCKHTQDPFSGQPFIMMLWEKAFVEVVYSFKIRKTGRDRFKKIILLIARKNGKSTLCAALAFAELMLGQGKSIVTASNNDDQAKIIFEEVGNMAYYFDPYLRKGKLRGKYVRINITEIINKVGKSKLKRLTDRQKSGLGKNINFVICDETNQLKATSTMPSQLIKGTSIKPNSKFINITTEGTENDGYLDRELKKAREILKGDRTDKAADSTLAWLYTQDDESEIWQVDEEDFGDIDHPCVWQKSNPSLYEVKQPTYIVEQLAESRIDKSERMQTLCFDFNIKQSTSEAWLLPSDVDNEETFDLSEFRNSVCLIGVDMSETVDLTACSVLLMKPDSEKKYVLTKFFLPESKINSTQDDDSGARYKEWLKDDLIIQSGGMENDLSKVADWIYSLYQEYNIYPYKIGYDQRFSKTFLDKIEYYFTDSKNKITEMVLQNKITMSNAMKLTEAELKAKNINYNNNPILRWNFLNCSMEMDSMGRVMAVKINNQPTKRIDGAVATIIMMEMYRRYKDEFKDMIGGR